MRIASFPEEGFCDHKSVTNKRHPPLSCALFGVIAGPITAISARVTICVNPIEVEDCAAIIFETSEGALITSSVTLGGADDMTNFRFCFEKVTMQSTNEPYAP